MPDNKYVVSDSNLTAFADAIRRKAGTSGGLVYPDGFIDGIEGIPSTSDVVVTDVIDAQGDTTRTCAFGNNVVTRDIDGVMPFSFSSAQAGSVMKMTQCGKVEQDGTPTPSAPVALVCNNGTLCLVDDELPLGYKRITGIRFDGNFYYDTGEQLTGDDDVTMTLANTSTTGQNVFGSYNGTTSGTKNFSLYLYGGGSTSNCYLRYGEQLVRPRYGSNQKTITFGRSGTDGFTTDVSVTPEEFTTEANAYIGMLPNSTSPAYTGSIIGNIIVHDAETDVDRLRYIPCEDPDGVIGYYEIINDQFLSPTGTGTPTAGSYDYSNSHFEIIGDGESGEVMTFNGRSVSVATLLAVGDYKDEHDFLTGKVTKRCGIKVLNGTESWIVINSRMQYNGSFDADPAAANAVLCTHYTPGSTSSASGNGNIELTEGNLYIRDSDHQSSVSAWNSFLEAQYDAGTPVIIIYPLQAPTEENVGSHSFSVSVGTNAASEQSSSIDDLELKFRFMDILA